MARDKESLYRTIARELSSTHDLWNHLNTTTEETKKSSRVSSPAALARSIFTCSVETDKVRHSRMENRITEEECRETLKIILSQVRSIKRTIRRRVKRSMKNLDNKTGIAGN